VTRRPSRLKGRAGFGVSEAERLEGVSSNVHDHKRLGGGIREIEEPGSWDDLGSDEGGAYGCQTAGCQTWRRPRRSLERERPERAAVQERVRNRALGSCSYHSRATGDRLWVSDASRSAASCTRTRQHKVNHSMVRCYAYPTLPFDPRSILGGAERQLHTSVLRQASLSGVFVWQGSKAHRTLRRAADQ
jgi:hypothetical protein